MRRPTDADGKPTGQGVFLEVKDFDKPRAMEVARQLAAMGFQIIATKGTSAAINVRGHPLPAGEQGDEGRPHVVDMISRRDLTVVNMSKSDATPSPTRARSAHCAARARDDVHDHRRRRAVVEGRSTWATWT